MCLGTWGFNGKASILKYFRAAFSTAERF